MRTRFFDAALAASCFLFLHGAAWAQHHGHAASGAGHPRGSSGASSQSSHGRAGEGQAPVRTVVSRPPVVITPRIITAFPSRPVFARPYYSFRPRNRVGFGFYLGYPVTYPNLYFYPNGFLYPSMIPTYPYASPIPTYSTPIPTYPYTSSVPTYPTGSATYGTVDSNGIAVAPGATGGVSFQITPADAAVFVDGVYVGTVNNFSATTPPLLLATGRHHFELRAQGYETMAFDVDVTSGQVVPYAGTLQPVRP
jgi:PEGA domain-containing protein